MGYVVLAAWLVQAAVGVVLLAGWARHGGSAAPVVLTHAGLSLAGLGLWVAFVATGHAGWGWGAFALITVGNGLGDQVLVGRVRRLTGTRSSYGRDWGRAVGATLTRRLPGRVRFHAWFAGVVYFAALAACLLATF